MKWTIAAAIGITKKSIALTASTLRRFRCSSAGSVLRSRRCRGRGHLHHRLERRPGLDVVGKRGEPDAVQATRLRQLAMLKDHLQELLVLVLLGPAFFQRAPRRLERRRRLVLLRPEVGVTPARRNCR
jgi:hypothetical protein